MTRRRRIPTLEDCRYEAQLAGGVALYDASANWVQGMGYINARIDSLPLLTTPVLKAFLWWQGESDVADGQHAAYQANLTQFIDDVRSEFSAILDPGFRFIWFRLSPSKQTNFDFDDMTTLVAGQEAVHAARSDTLRVTTDSLTFPDNTHADAPGYIGAGKAAATAFLTDSDQVAVAA